MSLSQVIRHEIMYYEKTYGKKPQLLVIADPELREEFFSESFPFTMLTEGADFKQPGHFMGVKFIWKNIHQYGGSCRWMLVGE